MSKKDLNRKPSGPKGNQGQKEKPTKDRESLRWLGYGVELAGVIGIFTYAGFWADEKFHTRPWLMISGMLLAMIGMFYLLLKETTNWRK